MEISDSSPNAVRGGKMAVIGAGGFVGARLMRILRSRPGVQGVAIVRSAKSLARLSNTPLEVRVVNTSNPADLAKGLADCETAVNAITGDVSKIPQETETVHTAARQAGCRLLVHLSSAVVFDRAKSAGLHDDSPPDVNNWMLYARGKAKGEVLLKEKMKDAGMRLVVLRPGLIWGPGANWATMVGDQLSRGSVCLSNGGRGIANLVYVDNLAEMIIAAHLRPNGPSGFYNAGDAETVTWSQYYLGLAKRLGYPAAEVRVWPDARLPLTPKIAVEWCLQRQPLYRTAKWILPRLGMGTKAVAKKFLKGEPRPPCEPGPSDGGGSAPRLSREHWSIQNTGFKLPVKKFQKDYGPVELTSFEAALDATAAWLRFAGYAAAPRTLAAGPFDTSHLW